MIITRVDCRRYCSFTGWPTVVRYSRPTPSIRTWSSFFYADDRSSGCWTIACLIISAIPASSRGISTDIAKHDIPTAISEILKRDNPPKLDIFAHCVGAAAFSMSVLGGFVRGATDKTPTQIGSVILHAIHPWVVPSKWNRVSAALASMYQDLLNEETITPIPPTASQLQDQIIDRIGASIEWNDDADTRHHDFERQTETGQLICNRLTVFYGREWVHENVDERTLANLHRLFGPAHLDMLRHVFYMCKRQRLTSATGDDIYVKDDGIDKNWTFPTMFATGLRNQVFDPRSAAVSTSIMTIMFKRFDDPDLRKRTGPDRRRPVCIYLPPDVGHMDFVFGRNAARHVSSEQPGSGIFDELDSFYANPFAYPKPNLEQLLARAPDAFIETTPLAGQIVTYDIKKSSSFPRNSIQAVPKGIELRAWFELRPYGTERVKVARKREEGAETDPVGRASDSPYAPLLTEDFHGSKKYRDHRYSPQGRHLEYRYTGRSLDDELKAVVETPNGVRMIPTELDVLSGLNKRDLYASNKFLRTAFEDDELKRDLAGHPLLDAIDTYQRTIKTLFSRTKVEHGRIAEVLQRIDLDRIGKFDAKHLTIDQLFSKLLFALSANRSVDPVASGVASDLLGLFDEREHRDRSLFINATRNLYRVADRSLDGTPGAIERERDIVMNVSFRKPWARRLKTIMTGSPTADGKIRILLGSCQWPGMAVETGDASAIFERMTARARNGADGLWLLGDQVYADAVANIVETRESGELAARRYRQLVTHDCHYDEVYRNKPMKDLLESLPVWMVVDDHELADNWSGWRNEPGGSARRADFKKRFDAAVAYQWRTFVSDKDNGPYKNPVADRDGNVLRGFWYRFSTAFLHCFAMDTRTERVWPADGRWRDRRIAGTDQLMEIGKWLAAVGASDEPKFLLSGSPFGLVRTREANDPSLCWNADDWAGYPRSMRELVELVLDHKVRNLFLVCGDAHLSGFATVTIMVDGKIGATITTIVCSGLNASLPFANLHQRDIASLQSLFDPPQSGNSSSTPIPNLDFRRGKAKQRITAHSRFTVMSHAQRQFGELRIVPARWPGGPSVEFEVFPEGQPPVAVTFDRISPEGRPREGDISRRAP